MAKTLVGLYDDLSQARAVVQDLVDAGFDRADISLVANAAAEEYSGYFDEEGRYRADADDMTAGEGAAAGAGIGATIGGIGGLLMGLGLLAIPGVGPALAAGPIVSALVGAGIGAAAGGLMGALVNSGVPEEEAGYYAEGVRRGGSLVSLTVDDSRVSDAEAIMNRHDPVDIDERAASWRESGFTRYDPNAEAYTADQIAGERGRWESDMSFSGATAGAASAVGRGAERVGDTVRDAFDGDDRDAALRRGDRGEEVIPVVEEEVAVGKREVERGGVRVRSYVREEPVEAEVTLREEEVRVERRPVNRDLTNADAAFQERTIEMTESAEEAVVAKRARVVEEVVVEKDVQEHTETVRDTVRRTEVEVEQLSPDELSDYRRHYETTFGSLGRSYEDYDVAYRYGSTLSRNPNYQGRDWTVIEADVRRDWERNNPGSAWDDFRDAIRHAFGRGRNRA